MFAQLKLSTRLALGFATLVGLAVLLGAMALLQMSRINASTVDIATSWLPSVRLIGEIRSTMNQIRRAEGDHLLSLDDREMDEIDARMVTIKETLSKQLVTYLPMIANPEEQKGYEAFAARRDAYFAVHAKLLALSRRGESSSADAKHLFRGESRDAFTQAVAALQKLVDINNDGSNQAAVTAAASYGQARLWTVGLLAVMAALAATTATLIVRSVMRQLGGEPVDAAHVAERVAQGDLSVPVAVKPGDRSSLMAHLHAMQQSLIKVVSEVRHNSDNVATASVQIAQGNLDLSQRTEEQASALEQTAATMEQLGGTVRSNADNAQQANQLAINASAVAAQGGAVVGQVVSTMDGISQSSRKIGDIIGVIDGIAFQTNILALNAAVEAARAGEQGRGFAVVASEVRSLAHRSAEAAKEIKGLISRSVEQVEQGTALVDRAGKTMGEIVGSIKRVSAIVAEISSASVEQSNGVQQVGEAVSQMDQVTQQNAALVEESAAAAESLKGQARQLVQSVAVFKLAVAA